MPWIGYRGFIGQITTGGKINHLGAASKVTGMACLLGHGLCLIKVPVEAPIGFLGGKWGWGVAEGAGKVTGGADLRWSEGPGAAHLLGGVFMWLSGFILGAPLLPQSHRGTEGFTETGRGEEVNG